MSRLWSLIRSCAGILLVVGATSAYGAAPLTITPIVIEGQVVPGVGNITSGFAAMEAAAVNNSGEWLVESDTTNADTNQDGVLMRGTGHAAGALYIREGQALASPAGASLDSFDSININASGNSGFNFFLSGTGGTNNDSGVYLNTSLVIQESNISTAPQFSPNTPYIGFFDVKINDSNQLLLVASVDDPAIATTVDRALVRVNTAVFGETVLAKEGDVLLGAGRTVEDFGTGPHDSAFNSSGWVLYSADSTGATSDDSAVFRYDGVNHVLLAQEGQPSGAVALRNWGSMAGVNLHMNNSGDWVMIGDLDGATTDDGLIVKNGTTVIAREGSSLPAIGGVFTFTSFGTGNVQIDDTGDVFWLGDWNDPDTTKDVGLFMNDMLLVQEGVTIIDGQILASISTVENNFVISPNGQWLIFEGVLADGRDGAFLIEVPEPATLLLVAAGGLLGRRRRR